MGEEQEANTEVARHEIVQLIDDIDGTAGDDVQRVEFGLDGVVYEIDLNGSNAARLRGVVAEYAPHARYVRGRRLQRQHAAAEPPLTLRVKGAPRPANAPTAGAVREWAAANGIELAARGRIPQAVEDQYRAGRSSNQPRRRSGPAGRKRSPPDEKAASRTATPGEPPPAGTWWGLPHVRGATRTRNHRFR